MRSASCELRVGISAGEVTREADDYFGEPVIEAARLCARADGGQILAAALVRAMAGRRSPFVFSPLGALDLKGLPELVETIEVSWPSLVDGGAAREIPPPPRLETVPSIGVIGRDIEAAVLADAYKRVSAGEGREIVLVSGEAGIGKTTLATQVARAAFGAGAVVLLGRCQEDLGSPYGPFVEALSHYVSYAADDALRAHVRSFGAELAQIVPALRQRLGDLPAPQSADPDTERYLLYNAVVGLLGQLCEDSPLVLVLDDLQWADKPSLQLLRNLVANTTLERLLIVGTYRHSELSGSHPLAEALGGAATRGRSQLSRPLRPRRLRGARFHGGGRRSRSRRRRGGTGPCALSRDGRQSVLRRRSIASSIGVRRHLPGQHRSVEDRRRTRGYADARQRTHGDRLPGGPTWRVRTSGPAARLGDRPGVRPRSAGPGDRSGPKTSSSTFWTPLPLRPWFERWRGSRGATALPMPSSSTPCTRTWAQPVGRGPTARWPRR